jgi:hypothetical protein
MASTFKPNQIYEGPTEMGMGCIDNPLTLPNARFEIGPVANHMASAGFGPLLTSRMLWPSSPLLLNSPTLRDETRRIFSLSSSVPPDTSIPTPSATFGTLVRARNAIPSTPRAYALSSSAWLKA